MDFDKKIFILLIMLFIERWADTKFDGASHGGLSKGYWLKSGVICKNSTLLILALTHSFMVTVPIIIVPALIWLINGIKGFYFVAIFYSIVHATLDLYKANKSYNIAQFFLIKPMLVIGVWAFMILVR
jgi:hypothetical protein